MKLMNRWDMTGVEVQDKGLKPYINLKPMIVPRTFGRSATQQFHKSQYMNIVERLMTHLFVPGHKSKKHFRSSWRASGKTNTLWKVLSETFEIIEKETKKNPIEALVRAIENSAPVEEITSFQVGGIMVRKAVVTSPQRRVDIALRLIAQSSYHKSFNNPKGIARCLADEITAGFRNDPQSSFAVKERVRIEKEASTAR